MKRKPKATIGSLPLELDIMIIERLGLKDALKLGKALLIPEQVAVQYCAYDRKDIFYLCYDFYDLKPSSFKFLFKNQRFQVEAASNEKTKAAFRTLDLDFLKKYIEQVQPDLNLALQHAASWGFTDAVKHLLSCAGVDPSSQYNYALIHASRRGRLEIVKLLLSCSRVDPSAQNNYALSMASQNGHLEIVKLLLADDRVDPSAQNNRALVCASENGHLEIVKLLLSHDRVDPSAQNNRALAYASGNGHLEIVKLVESHPRFRA
jgi:ankyrin repeat protein